MSAMQRNKGAAAEREVAAIIRDHLGYDVHRNWQGQSAVGGADLDGVPWWAVEVKRAATPKINQWWAQAQSQAGDRKPVLIFRIDGHGRGLRPEHKWQCILWLKEMRADARDEHTVQMCLEAWMDLVRETI